MKAFVTNTLCAYGSFVAFQIFFQPSFFLVSEWPTVGDVLMLVWVHSLLLSFFAFVNAPVLVFTRIWRELTYPPMSDKIIPKITYVLSGLNGILWVLIAARISSV